MSIQVRPISEVYGGDWSCDACGEKAALLIDTDTNLRELELCADCARELTERLAPTFRAK